MPLYAAIALSPLWLLGPILVLVGAVHTRRWIARRRQQLANDAAHDLPHGDVPHVPFGATLRPLVEQFHGGEVGRG